MLGSPFKTSAQRREEELRRQQGLPTSTGLSSNIFKASAPMGLNLSASEPIGSNRDGTTLNSDGTSSGSPIIGQNRDGSAITDSPADVGATVSPGLIAAFPEVAAVAAAGYGMYSGIKNASEQFQRGGKEKQTALIRGSNAIFNPLSGYATSDDAQKALGLVSPNPLGRLMTLGDVLGVNIFSGKDKDQTSRDSTRQQLVDSGFVNVENGAYNVNLANGGKFDIGKDGGARLQNQDGTDRRYYEVDLSNPLAGDAIASLAPLAYLVSSQEGPNAKSKDWFNAYFANAVLSNANDPDAVRNNILSLYSQYGWEPDKVRDGIDQLKDAGIIDEQAQGVMQAKINEISTPSNRGAQPIQLPGSLSINMPKPVASKPQVDLSLLKTPKSPYDQAQERYAQMKTDKYFQTRNV